MVLSKIIASTGRQKILRALSYTHKIGITQPIEATNSTYNELMRNVHILERQDIVKVLRVGRRCYVSLNYDNVQTKILLESLKLLDSRQDFKQLHGTLIK